MKKVDSKESTTISLCVNTKKCEVLGVSVWAKFVTKNKILLDTQGAMIIRGVGVLEKEISNWEKIALTTTQCDILAVKTKTTCIFLKTLYFEYLVVWY